MEAAKESAKTVLVVGGGAVGTNAALALDKLGHKVILAHDQNNLFAGSASNAAFIWHKTGAEYCREGHQETGELCIAGDITQRLMTPMKFFETDICTPDNPLKFFVSEDSASENAPYDSNVPVERFEKNNEHMRQYFKKIYDATKKYYNETDAQTTERLGANPETFSRKISLNDFPAVKNVVTGATAAGGGVNLPHLYAFYKAAIWASKVQVEFNSTIESVEKLPSGQYEVLLTNGMKSTVDSIILAAGYGNPELVTRIPDAEPSVQGTYYLNTTLQITLPEGAESEQIFFTLQQKFGGMLACIDKKARRYALYSPYPGRSQIDNYIYDQNNPKSYPKEWFSIMENGLDVNSENVKRILEDASRLYPILKKARVVAAPARVVFNADSKDSKDGQDRRVRAMQIKEVAPKVFVTHGPKLTNSLLTALSVSHAALLSMGLPGLATSKERGVGPLDLDVLEISRKINFMDIKHVRLSAAIPYAEYNKLPVSMVNTNAPEFAASQLASNRFITTKEFLDAAGEGILKIIEQYTQQQNCGVNDRYPVYEGVTNLKHFRNEKGTVTLHNPSALHIAAQNGKIKAVELLLKLGADVNARTAEGWTPLHIAYTQGQIQFANILCAHGASLYAEDKQGHTPLMDLRDVIAGNTLTPAKRQIALEEYRKILTGASQSYQKALQEKRCTPGEKYL